MAHGLYKQLARRANSYRVLCDKAFGITSNPQYDGYKVNLLQWFIISFLIKNMEVE